MSETGPSSQRNTMRNLYRIHNGDETIVCAAFAQAERDGHVARKSNRSRITPESYAKALLRSGIAEGWIS